MSLADSFPRHVGVNSAVTATTDTDRYEELSRRKNELLRSKPWFASGARTINDWNAWAEQVAVLLRSNPSDERVSALALIDASTLGDFTDFADFSDLLFPGDGLFERAVFRGGVSFSRARFSGAARFAANRNDVAADTTHSADFYQRTSFVGTVFEKGAVFAGAVFRGAATFDGSYFYETCEFAEAEFRRSCSFSACSFMSSASFANAIFNVMGHATSKISFERAKFSQRPDFSAALFRGSISLAVKASFDQVIWPNGADFVGTQFGDTSNAAAPRSVDLVIAPAKCDGPVNCSKARFRGRFGGMAAQRFDGAVRLDDAIFFDVADFSNAKFLEPDRIAFSAVGTRFGKDAVFDETTFEATANFEGATFCEGASFQGAIIRNSRSASVAATFHRATFEGGVNFEGATFGLPHKHLLTNFSSCVFGERTEPNFTGARFLGMVTFEHSKVCAILDFRRVKFGGPVQFGDCTTQRRLSFTSSTFDDAVDLSNLRAGDALEWCGSAMSRSVVRGACKLASVRIDGGFVSRNVDWMCGIDFAQAIVEGKVLFQASKVGSGWDGGASIDQYRLNVARARLTGGLEFDDLQICSELVLTRLPGSLSIEVHDTTVSGVLPNIDRVEFDDGGEMHRLKWDDLTTVIARTVGAGGDEREREASRRLRTLAHFADLAHDADERERLLDKAHEIAPQALQGSVLVRVLSGCLLGRRRDGVGRALTILAILGLACFPLLYLTASKYMTEGTALHWAQEDLVRQCVVGSGTKPAAALYVSLRNTLFAIPDTEDRARQASECL